MSHGLHPNNSCKGKFTAIKTYISKAYDMIKWRFIEKKAKDVHLKIRNKQSGRINKSSPIISFQTNGCCCCYQIPHNKLGSSSRRLITL